MQSNGIVCHVNNISGGKLEIVKKKKGWTRKRALRNAEGDSVDAAKFQVG